jgi:hypothetical protein
MSSFRRTGSNRVFALGPSNVCPLVVSSIESSFISETMFFRKFDICLRLATTRSGRHQLCKDRPYRFCVPSASSNFEPGEMSAERCRAKHSVWVLFYLFSWHGFIHGNLFSALALHQARYQIVSRGISLPDHLLHLWQRKEYELP